MNSADSFCSLSLRSSSAVPDLAIVPISSTTSSRDMPMPLSRTVRVRASGSTSISMCRSDVSTSRSLLRIDSRRSLSSASEALEISSRRKMSLFE
jgi:hypothetical protein